MPVHKLENRFRSSESFYRGILSKPDEKLHDLVDANMRQSQNSLTPHRGTSPVYPAQARILQLHKKLQIKTKTDNFIKAEAGLQKSQYLNVSQVENALQNLTELQNIITSSQLSSARKNPQLLKSDQRKKPTTQYYLSKDNPIIKKDCLLSQVSHYLSTIFVGTQISSEESFQEFFRPPNR
jgi:hypothetical protein